MRTYIVHVNSKGRENLRPLGKIIHDLTLSDTLIYTTELTIDEIAKVDGVISCYDERVGKS